MKENVPFIASHQEESDEIIWAENLAEALTQLEHPLEGYTEILEVTAFKKYESTTTFVEVKPFEQQKRGK